MTEEKKSKNSKGKKKAGKQAEEQSQLNFKEIEKAVTGVQDWDSGESGSSDFEPVVSDGYDSLTDTGSESVQLTESENEGDGVRDSAYDVSSETDSSEDEVAPQNTVGYDAPEESDSEDDDAPEESDSSEDEVPPRNTVGDIPFEWYREEEHAGYDPSGKKIKKKERENKLDKYLEMIDNAKNWRRIYNERDDEVVELTKEETKMIRKILKGMAPHPEFDPYQDSVDWVKVDKAEHPFPDAPEPKRRFIPSKWESKMVVRLVRGIRKGLIKVDDKPKEEDRVYLLWSDDPNSTDRHHIPAPKPKLPGHEESYNPSLEYIPTEEEIKSYDLMYEEDRPKFIPKRFTSIRSVPAYDKAVRETFDRCLDLYLCPRTHKKRINIDPESLKPKLPSRKDLKPYPSKCYLEYKGHKGPVVSISTDSTGQWIASGSKDGTVRIWEVDTGRCLRVWELGEAVQHVAWNPSPELSILAATVGQDVFLLKTGFGTEEEQKRVDDLLQFQSQTIPDASGGSENIVKWSQDDIHGGIRLNHFKTVSSVEWHRKGDYFSTLMPHDILFSILYWFLFWLLFSATKLVKKLETGLREVSSIAIHAGGDNVIVGSKDGKLCWFDMDLSSQPYKVLNCHKKDINKVAFHRSYPLFASCSDDCTAYIFHGMVYSDLNQNPLIVPLEILRGHASLNGRGGVLDCKFHPRQPWLFTAGDDSVIKLYCH
ncbi:OLC1v1002335C1 [Oldenlandia corymbosa var. corymbosa]|uniref:Ribosome biogenesis protein BOP1 homolog n=1 Tax=Oldenlandia corymbosa var. corymbosa TaxID=529605 RepID=A0AAV1D7F0_OLDCO|nr:OLC1v1002335C1 [Oldenlandia corymbosa var. corymbosa]